MDGKGACVHVRKSTGGGAKAARKTHSSSAVRPSARSAVRHGAAVLALYSPALYCMYRVPHLHGRHLAQLLGVQDVVRRGSRLLTLCGPTADEQVAEGVRRCVRLGGGGRGASSGPGDGTCFENKTHGPAVLGGRLVGEAGGGARRLCWHAWRGGPGGGNEWQQRPLQHERPPDDKRAAKAERARSSPFPAHLLAPPPAPAPAPASEGSPARRTRTCNPLTLMPCPARTFIFEAVMSHACM